VQPDGGREHPAARDFDLLQLLINSSPGVVSRNQILDVLWGEDKFLNQRTIDNMIVRLRQSLGDTQSTRSDRCVGLVSMVVMISRFPLLWERARVKAQGENPTLN